MLMSCEGGYLEEFELAGAFKAKYQTYNNKDTIQYTVRRESYGRKETSTSLGQYSIYTGKLELRKGVRLFVQRCSRVFKGIPANQPAEFPDLFCPTGLFASRTAPMSPLSCVSLSVVNWWSLAITNQNSSEQFETGSGREVGALVN